MTNTLGCTFLSILLFYLVPSSLSAKISPALSDSVKYEFAPIVVTGQRFEMPQKDVAASISSISAIQLRQTNLNTVADAVSYLTPGVFTTRRSVMGYGVSSLAAGNIKIRGLGGSPNTEVLILIDGRPDFQGIFGHPIADGYQLDNVDHIEVLRGPASAVYGTNAIGGVVNIITKQLGTDGFHTKLSASYGSFNSQQYLLQHSGKVGRLQYFLSASRKQSDGHRDNSSYNGEQYSAKARYTFNPHFNLTINSLLTPYEFRDPGPDGAPQSGYFDYGDINRSSADITLSNNFATTDGTIKLHGNFGTHTLSDGWYSEDQTNGIIAFQNFQLVHQIKATLGFDIKRYGGLAKSSGVKLGTFFNDEYAFYAHAQKKFSKYVVIASGIRMEDNSHFGKEWIPKFGLVLHPFASTAIRSTVSKGFRTPTVKDMYLFPPANAELKPERLWNYEMGVQQLISNSLSVDVCGFYYRGEQLIETLPVTPGRLLNQNTGENKAHGMELSLNYRPTSQIDASISYSYLNTETILPYSPNKFNFMFNYKLHEWALSFYGEKITNLYTSYQPVGFPPKIITEREPNYTLINFKVTAPIVHHVRLSLGIENVLDTQYEILKDYPMPGRTLMTSMSYEF